MTVFINNREFFPLGNGIYQDKETDKKYRAKVVLIDQGFSIPNKAESNDENSIILSRFAVSIWGNEIPSKFIEAIEKLKYNSFQQKLKKILDDKSIELNIQIVQALCNERYEEAAKLSERLKRRNS